MTWADKRAWRSIRHAVCERDGWQCCYCGIGLTEASSGLSTAATADHIVPRSDGGTDNPENLRACCFSCNASRGERSIEWLRTFRGLQQSRYAGLISVRQYEGLVALGVPLEPLPIVVFHFETRCR